MTLRVVVDARGHGQATAAEQDILDAWRHELFAEDREVLEAFSWEDKRSLGFDLRTYRDDELAGFAHVFVRLARRDEEPRMTCARISACCCAFRDCYRSTPHWAGGASNARF